MSRRDDSDRRWIVAVHEAGHYEAARLYRGRGPKAVIHGSGHRLRGLTTVRYWTGSWLEMAVFTQAGIAACRLVTGYDGLGTHDDLADLRRICHRRHVDQHEAQRLAVAFADKHRRQIESTAVRLYRDGRI